MEVTVGQGDKVVITCEIVFSGPGRYARFEETIQQALSAGVNNATGVKVVGHRLFDPPKGTPEEQAGFKRVRR